MIVERDRRVVACAVDEREHLIGGRVGLFRSLAAHLHEQETISLGQELERGRVQMLLALEVDEAAIDRFQRNRRGRQN